MIATILVIVLPVIIVVATLAFLPLLQPQRTDVCGSTTEDAEKVWFEVLIDTVDPSIRDVIKFADEALRATLELHYLSSDIALLVQTKGHDVSIGRAYLYEMGARYFVAVGLFAGCSITSQSAQGYEKGIQGDTVKLAVLLALAIAAPQTVSLFATVEFLIDFIFGWQGYLPGSPSIVLGPQIQGLESGAMPESTGDGLNRQWNQYFTP